MTIVRRSLILVIRAIGMLTRIAMVSLVVFDLAGCSAKTVTTDETSEPTQAQTDAADQPRNEAIVIGVFADAYNSLAQSPITLTGSFVPKDPSGDHYRPEYRLGPYSQAVGVTYTDGGMVVDIVMYGINAGSGANDNLRVYADGPTDQVVGFYRTAINVLDPDVPTEEIDKAIDREIGLGYGEGLVPDTDIRSMFLGVTGDMAECMLDSKSYPSTVLRTVGR